MRRDTTIDCLKGVCMIWVLLGHNNGTHPFVLQFCHPAVMGMFFIISGYLINEKLNLCRRLRSICLQFCFFAALSVVWRIGYGFITHESLDFATWGMQLVHGRDFGLNIPMWFLMAYAEILLLVYVVRKISTVYVRWIVAILMMICGTVMKHNSLNPFYIAWTLQYMPFFMLGQELYSYPHTWLVGRYPFLTMLGTVALVGGRFYVVPDTYYVRVIVDTVLAIYIVCLLYSLFKNQQMQLRVVAYIGRNSLVVLCMHILILDVVWRLWYRSFGVPDMYGAAMQTITVLLLCWPCCSLYNRFIKSRIK